MFRAMNHEGVSAECLFELLAGDRQMGSDQRLRAFTACAVMAAAMQRIIRGG